MTRQPSVFMSIHFTGHFFSFNQYFQTWCCTSKMNLCSFWFHLFALAALFSSYCLCLCMQLNMTFSMSESSSTVIMLVFSISASIIMRSQKSLLVSTNLRASLTAFVAPSMVVYTPQNPSSNRHLPSESRRGSSASPTLTQYSMVDMAQYLNCLYFTNLSHRIQVA
jgi:hypothetical protein